VITIIVPVDLLLVCVIQTRTKGIYVCVCARAREGGTEIWEIIHHVLIILKKDANM